MVDKDKNEKLNIVDEQDNVIGEDIRGNIHKNNLLHREVHVWLYNAKGEILFQERSLDRETHPGLLDASVSGHVEANTSYEEAALKEASEEVGITINKKNLTFIKKVRRNNYDKVTDKKNNTFKAIYAYHYDDEQGEIRLEKGKSLSLKFWSLDKVLNLTEEEKKKFTPFLLTEEYLDIFRKIKELV